MLGRTQCLLLVVVGGGGVVVVVVVVDVGRAMTSTSSIIHRKLTC